MDTTRNARGITLIELMVTIAIIAVVASIAIPMYSGYISSGYRTECNNEIAAIRLAQEEFFLENNAYFPNPAATANGVAAIEAASGNLYSSGYTTAAALAAANCTYSVTSTAAPSYTITATGANNLPVTVVITYTK